MCPINSQVQPKKGSINWHCWCVLFLCNILSIKLDIVMSPHRLEALVIILQNDSVISLLKRPLEKWLLLVTSQLFTCMEKCGGPCLPTGNTPVGWMVVHDTKMITQKTVETMIQWKSNSTEVNKKVCNWVTSTALKQKLDRCNWSEVSQHEFKGVEMRRKRSKDSARMVPKSETRAQKFRKGDGGLLQLL